MVATYTLHVPADADPGDPEALDGAELIKDGFSLPAFLFTFFWFFWNRLWLAGIAVLAAVIALAVLLQVLGVGAGATVVAETLLSFLIGLEGNALKRWTWRRKKPAIDVVGASNLEEAETKAFSRWLADYTEYRVPRASASFPPTPYGGPEPVIGLFPDTERRR